MVTIRIPKELYNTKITFEQFCVCQMENEYLKTELQETKKTLEKFQIRRKNLRKEKRELYKIQNGKDLLTGFPLVNETKVQSKRITNNVVKHIHIHHIIPVELGGTNEIENLILVSEETHYLIHASENKIVSSETLIAICQSEERIHILNKLREQVGNKPLLLEVISSQNEESCIWDNFQGKLGLYVRGTTQRPNEPETSIYGMVEILKAYGCGFVNIPALESLYGQERANFINRFIKDGEISKGNIHDLLQHSKVYKNKKHLQNVENEYSGVIENINNYKLPLEEVTKEDMKRMFCLYKQGFFSIPSLDNKTKYFQYEWVNSKITKGEKLTFTAFEHYLRPETYNRVKNNTFFQHYYSNVMRMLVE